MPNLRGREVSQDHGREQERSRSQYDAESDDEFDFGLAEGDEGGSAEEFVRGCGGNNRKKEPKSIEHGGDEANRSEKAKTEDESETVDSVWMFDSETPNQLKAKRKKAQQKRRQHCDSKGAGKGCTCREADRTGRGARAMREARRNQSEESEER